jgi:hypothetical protein
MPWLVLLEGIRHPRRHALARAAGGLVVETVVMMQRVTEGTAQDELPRHGLIAASRAQDWFVGRFEGVRLRRRRSAYVIKFTVDADLVSMIENVKRERRTTVDIRVATNENTARTAVLPAKDGHARADGKNVGGRDARGTARAFCGLRP